MELTTYQLLYVQTVYDYFQENFQWPTFRQVQKKHLSTYRDFRALDIAKSIEDNPARHFHSGLEASASVTLKEIHQLPQAQQDLDDLLKVIQYSVEKYIAEDKDGVKVTSEEISQNLHLDETAIRKIYPLSGLTTGIFGSNSTSLDYRTWHFEVLDSAVDYQDLRSIEDYFARREEIINSIHASQSAYSAMDAIAMNTYIVPPTAAVQPRISQEVVDAITDPKIKQFCAELNNTPDENVFSLTQGIGETLKWALWYQAQKVGTSIPARNMGLERLLDEAVARPYYSGNAVNRFLRDFKNNFLKTSYDMVRHDSTYIPNGSSAFGPAIDALEHILKETFPI